MARSSHVWFPDLGDHFGDKFGDFDDEIWGLKGAGIFSIFLLGEKIRHECARSSHVTSRPAGENYIRRALGRRRFLPCLEPSPNLDDFFLKSIPPYNPSRSTHAPSIICFSHEVPNPSKRSSFQLNQPNSPDSDINSFGTNSYSLRG
ncbi:hypothetical protein AVEN_99574-1 [Araneus ventricosus]|uniref:Uncharacterized protein n=1 Tax=Araneus ventricosus TaxID=182803 RepID=A0A4Y2IBT7_ARAVE|nr:hypothetical protein AVEN_99574-1 [Araneus ventricosus]